MSGCIEILILLCFLGFIGMLMRMVWHEIEWRD